MPIWTVRVCQVLPPPAAKRHRLQAIQLPRAPGAKREPLPAPLRSEGWAGPPPGREEGVRGSQPAAPPCVRSVFAAAPASTAGGCGTPSPPWKWQLRMLILLPLPFMDSLASPGAHRLARREMVSALQAGLPQLLISLPPLMAPLSLFPYLSGLCFLQK